MLLCIVMLSYNNDDDNGPITVTTLDGDWDMTSYSFFGPQPPNLESGDVIWNFNNAQREVTIENNVSATYPYLPESGTYNFTTLSNSVIIIEDLSWGDNYNFEFVDDKLNLSYQDNPEIADDELFISFQKR